MWLQLMHSKNNDYEKQKLIILISRKRFIKKPCNGAFCKIHKNYFLIPVIAKEMSDTKSFPAKSSERVTHTCWFHYKDILKSRVVHDPLREFCWETYYFTIKTQISYQTFLKICPWYARKYSGTKNTFKKLKTIKNMSKLFQLLINILLFHFQVVG